MKAYSNDKAQHFFGNHLKIDSECDMFIWLFFNLVCIAKSTFNEDMQRNDCVRASLPLFLDCKFTQCISVGGNNVPGETGGDRKKSVCGRHRGVFSALCHLTAALFTQTKWKPTSCSVIYAQYCKIIFKNNRLDIECNLKCFFFLMMMIWISRPCWCGRRTLCIHSYYQGKAARLSPSWILPAALCCCKQWA